MPAARQDKKQGPNAGNAKPYSQQSPTKGKSREVEHVESDKRSTSHQSGSKVKEVEQKAKPKKALDKRPATGFTREEDEQILEYIERCCAPGLPTLMHAMSHRHSDSVRKRYKLLIKRLRDSL
ncbi:unnamed protein product [Sympodiomycopsis kandeliae]